jgi:hypothetical protein
MPTAVKKAVSKPSKKKDGPDIKKILEKALESFKALFGEKKFNNRIKKAHKAFTKGMSKKAPVKKAATKKKAVKQPAKPKKAAVKKTAPGK